MILTSWDILVEPPLEVHVNHTLPHGWIILKTTCLFGRLDFQGSSLVQDLMRFVNRHLWATIRWFYVPNVGSILSGPFGASGSVVQDFFHHWVGPHERLPVTLVVRWLGPSESTTKIKTRSKHVDMHPTIHNHGHCLFFRIVRADMWISPTHLAVPIQPEEMVNWHPGNGTFSHTIHGTGIFTYMDG